MTNGSSIGTERSTDTATSTASTKNDRRRAPEPGIAESQLAGSRRIHALRRGEFPRRPAFHVDAGPAGSHL